MLLETKKIQNNGFTFVEVTMVIAILAVLAVVGIPKYVDLTSLSKQRAEAYIISTIQIGIIAEQAKNQLP